MQLLFHFLSDAERLDSFSTLVRCKLSPSGSSFVLCLTVAWNWFRTCYCCVESVMEIWSLTTHFSHPTNTSNFLLFLSVECPKATVLNFCCSPLYILPCPDKELGTCFTSSNYFGEWTHLLTSQFYLLMSTDLKILLLSFCNLLETSLSS